MLCGYIYHSNICSFILISLSHANWTCANLPARCCWFIQWCLNQFVRLPIRQCKASSIVKQQCHKIQAANWAGHWWRSQYSCQVCKTLCQKIEQSFKCRCDLLFLGLPITLSQLALMWCNFINYDTMSWSTTFSPFWLKPFLWGTTTSTSIH